MKVISPEEIQEVVSELSWDGDRYIPRFWNKEEITISRALIRAQVFVDRGGRQEAISDLGGKYAAHYHEIVNRLRTPEGSVLRWLSYQPELCALLTADEHGAVHNTESRNQLLLLNYARYGEGDVRKVFNLMQDISIVSLGITLP